MSTEPRLRPLAEVCTALRARHRVLISSHARPDGDSIGSQLALAFAQRSLGKDVRVVNRDPAPAPFLVFPGVGDIEIAERATGEFDAAVVLECSDLSRTGLAGLERYFIVNVDHHPGNAMYGAVNWFDGSVSACGEMVFDIVEGLGAPLSEAVATHLYVAILTDTGSFHFSGMTGRTFEICRRAVEAGARPADIARAVYDNNSLGRIKLLGSLLNALELEGGGRLAVLYLDESIVTAAGATPDDTDGIINVPLTVGHIDGVAFFRQIDAASYRVSLRSKGDVDVGGVAALFGGGGHKNAAGCTVPGSYSEVRPLVVERVIAAMDRAGRPSPESRVPNPESRVPNPE